MNLLLLCMAFAASVAIALPARASFPDSQRWLVRCAMPLCVLFMFSSITIYHAFGAPHVIDKIYEREMQMDQAAERIKLFSSEVTEEPAQAEAWAKLGISFMEAEQYSEAVRTLKQAVVLSGGNPAYILALVKAQIFEANGKVTPEAKQGLSLLKTMIPENDEMLYFTALSLVQDNRKEEAAGIFKSIAGRDDALPALRQLALKQLKTIQ